MIHPAVFNTSKVFSKKGIRHVVLSPGSRNAPLILSFTRNPDFKVYNIIDERSAGFIALGMAQKLNQPVVLCCTSGTAVLNYAPAIAEAFYQQIPLIVLSADRPSEWQGQRDGQTIRQPGSLSNFVKKTFELPSEFTGKNTEWEYINKLNEAINLGEELPAGPVHINIPFREPFYPDENLIPEFDEHVKVIQAVSGNLEIDFSELVKEWNTYQNRLIVAGQCPRSLQITSELEALGDACAVVCDIISNCNPANAIRHQDLFLIPENQEQSENLRPHLLVTFGRSVISKNLKLFLRKNPPEAHWHFDKSMVQADTFQSITRMVKADFCDFLRTINLTVSAIGDFNQQLRVNYARKWSILDKKTNRNLTTALNEVGFCEFKAFGKVMQALPIECDLHLGNSMPVRYANFIQHIPIDVEVFANRGTSGIDGTNGTAVGSTLISDTTTVLLTGDLAFFYDRNAFFHHYDMKKLKIIVFNNHGGGIFRLIKGPAGLPELDQHFETRHNHSAKFSALEFGFDYYRADDEKSLEKALSEVFKKDNAPKLLEIFTEPELNQKLYHWIKNKVNE